LTLARKTVKMAAIMDKNYLTQEKYDELVKELEELRTDRRREVADRLEFAKSLGDLSENAEYHSAREEQANLEERIVQLESLFKNSQIISAQHGSTVEVGSTVGLKESSGTKQTFTIVGSEEADVAGGKISYHSPLGGALLGKKKGDAVEVNAPRGKVTYQIVHVE
jgi:transcription elongation factor GreA